MKQFQESPYGIHRRAFLKNTAMAGGALLLSNACFSGAAAGRDRSDNKYMDIRSKRKIGSLEVSSLGLGCMSMAGVYNAPQPKDDMVAGIRKAYDSGVTFFDTAEVYGPFLSEEMVGEALAPFRNKVSIATKFGFNYNGNSVAGRNAKPEYIKARVEGSLQRLKTDVIDLLYLHRMDTAVPVEDIAGAVKDLISAGKVRNFGMSEVSPATLRKAHAVQPVAALQSEYSMLERVMEHEMLSVCAELGIAFVPWGPVARGLLTGRFDEHSTFDFRRAEVAYLKPDNLAANLKLLDMVKQWATQKGVTPAQFSLAWLLAQKPFIIPIPGTTNPAHLTENLGGWNVRLTEDDLKDIRTAIGAIQLGGVRAPESVDKDL